MSDPYRTPAPPPGSRRSVSAAVILARVALVLLGAVAAVVLATAPWVVAASYRAVAPEASGDDVFTVGLLVAVFAWPPLAAGAWGVLSALLSLAASPEGDDA
jgi:hypothetical protein